MCGCWRRRASSSAGAIKLPLKDMGQLNSNKTIETDMDISSYHKHSWLFT